MSARSKAIREATTADIPAAAATLAAAFAEYPWTRWSIPSEGYESRLRELQAVYLAHALEHGTVLVSEDVSGVIAVLPPGCPEPTEDKQSRVAELMGDKLMMVFGTELPARLPDSWDLATIGVHPEHAGKGLGSALLLEALSRIAASEHPRVSLETSAASNVALYKRHGFTVTHHTQIADGPEVHTMAAEL